MGLIDYLKTQFLEIIEWQDDSRDTLSFRYPDGDKEIKNGAQLIVRESQMAQFIYLGQFGDTFGPGKHTLTTDNIPILSTLKGWKYGLHSPFKADVYFVNTRLFTGNKWGTANPIMLRDADFGIVRTRAYGIFDFHVTDVKLFLKEVAGTDDHFRLDEFADTMRSRIVSVFTDALASAKVPVLDVASRYQELGAALLPLINPAVTSKYGIEISQLHCGKCFRAAGSRASHRQAQQHGRGGQSQRLREIPDGRVHGQGRRRSGRDGRHGGGIGRRSGHGPANDGRDEHAPSDSAGSSAGLRRRSLAAGRGAWPSARARRSGARFSE